MGNHIIQRGENISVDKSGLGVLRLQLIEGSLEPAIVEPRNLILATDAASLQPMRVV